MHLGSRGEENLASYKGGKTGKKNTSMSTVIIYSGSVMSDF